MAAIEWDVVRAILIADPVVGPLVTKGGVSRVYPNRAPQDPKVPFIILARPSVFRQFTLEQPSTVSAPSIQLDAMGASAKDVRELADACRKALNGFSGDYNGQHVNGIFIDSERDFWEEAVELHRVTMTMTVNFREALV